MRTFKATFSGGGRLVVTYDIDIGPHTWEATGVPERLQKERVHCAVGSFPRILEIEAERAGETVEIEDDGGPVAIAEM